LYPVANDKYVVFPPAAQAWVGHDNQIATWTGAEWTFQVVDIGQVIYDLECDVYYIWDGTSYQTVPVMLPHHSLTELDGYDDHMQYARLAGRANGQSIVGGVAASENLNLDSTAHGTKGIINVKSRLTRSGSALKLGAYGAPSEGTDTEGNTFFGGDVEIAGRAVLTGGISAVNHNDLANRSAVACHQQYANLAGREAGQSLNGGIGAGESLELDSTAHGTKGKVIIKSTVKREAGLIVRGRKVTHTDSPVTLLDSDQWLCANASEGDVLIGLPVSLAVFGREVDITEDAGVAGGVTVRPESPARIVDPASGELAAECVLTSARATYTFRFDGDNWLPI
jgi:hypothetical protein